MRSPKFTTCGAAEDLGKWAHKFDAPEAHRAAQDYLCAYVQKAWWPFDDKGEASFMQKSCTALLTWHTFGGVNHMSELCAICEKFFVEHWVLFESRASLKQILDSDALFRVACGLSRVVEKVSGNKRQYAPVEEYQTMCKRARTSSDKSFWEAAAPAAQAE
ncbi:hypothetical protein WJX81_005396 [Elliptochloris bilobata]|uniref:Uncharacterized protein n=1 Tax=Elliptochloris bilobata TaxID=381761 RepID=A0AAW1SIA5_9CHLO